MAENYGSSLDRMLNPFVLWKCIYQEKIIIAAFTLISIFLAGSYLLVSKPIYQSEAYFVPVEQKFIQNLTRWDLLLDRKESYSADDLFDIFKQSISSRTELWKFFINNRLYGFYDKKLSEVEDIDSPQERKDIEEIFDKFYQDFKVQEPTDANHRKYFSISLELAAPDKEVQILLDNYISRIRTKTKAELLEAVQSEQNSRIALLKLRIHNLKEIAKKEKSDRLAQLDEAISIARNLNLKEPPTIGAKATIKGVSNQGLPLYYLGYRLLEAERIALKLRESNDPFIHGLRDLDQQLSLINNYSLSASDFSIVQVDQAAKIGNKIRPKETLILVLATLLGLILGVFVALIKIANVKKK